MKEVRIDDAENRVEKETIHDIIVQQNFQFSILCIKNVINQINLQKQSSKTPKQKPHPILFISAPHPQTHRV